MNNRISLMAVFTVGLFIMQYQLLTTRKELEYQHLEGEFEGLELSIDRELLREIIIRVGRRLLQILPECVPPSTQLPSPKLYIITPTFRRPEQLPDMTRLAQTLMHVKNMKWLVVEDANVTTPGITELLKRTGIDFEHLLAPMPQQYRDKKGAKPRGVSNRMRGLAWIRANATDGVLYFADDDNTYDIRLFEEMRKTKRVSMWPVGLVTAFGLSTPIVNKEGEFKGFYDGWLGGRKFAVDMAEFAVNVKFLLQRPNATMPFSPGVEESEFLKSLAPFEPQEVELLADNCTKILVWHTQTKKNPNSAPLNETLHKDTNLYELKKQMV